MTAAEIRPPGRGNLRFSLRRLVPSWPLIAGLAILIRTIAGPSVILIDPDTYLHIAAGQWMIDHRALPTHDPFSHSMPGAPWVPHEWLAEIILALVYRGLGWGGLIFLSAACFAASMAMMTRRLLVHAEPFTVIVVIAACSSFFMGHVLARPHILTFPILVLWAGALFAARDAGRGPPFWLLPLMALWANLHGSFMFGLALAGYLGAEAVLFPGPQGRRWVQGRSWALFVLAAILVSLLTPNGLDGFLQPFRLMNMPTLQSSFMEWASPNFQEAQSLEVWVLGTMFVGLALGVRVPLSRVVLLLGLFHMMLTHQRHADLLGLVGPLAVAASLGPQLAARIRSDPPTPLARRFAALAAPAGPPAVALALLIVAGIGLLTLHRPLARADDLSTPGDALAAADRLGLRGPVFNSQRFGGYLVFKGIPPFIDGRIEMYGDAFLKRYLDAELGRAAELTGVLDQYRIEWTLLAPDALAVEALDRLPGWRRVYSDKFAVIHARGEQPGR